VYLSLSCADTKQQYRNRGDKWGYWDSTILPHFAPRVNPANDPDEPAWTNRLNRLPRPAAEKRWDFAPGAPKKKLAGMWYFQP
jgi:hypothetical protein